MIYRIRNPYAYAEKGVVTELDTETGDVWHIDPDGSRRHSDHRLDYWLRVLRHKDLEQEHLILDRIEYARLDEGL